jgi:hypothetical protein
MKSVDIFLLGKRLTPYFEERIPDIVEELEGKDPSSQNLSRWQRLKLKVYQIYKKLEARFPLHERLCTALLTAEEVRIYYSTGNSLYQAAHVFEHYLHHQRSQERFWMMMNLALCGLGGLLMPLPGPNLFFYYPAARTFSHFRAWKGARRGGKMQLNYLPSEQLKDFEHRITLRSARNRSDIISEMSQALDLPGLTDFLKKNNIHF